MGRNCVPVLSQTGVWGIGGPAWFALISGRNALAGSARPMAGPIDRPTRETGAVRQPGSAGHAPPTVHGESDTTGVLDRFRRSVG